MKARIHTVGTKSPKSRLVFGAVALTSALFLAGCIKIDQRETPSSSSQNEQNYIAVEAFSGGVLIGQWTVEEKLAHVNGFDYFQQRHARLTDVHGNKVRINGEFIVTGISATSVQDAIEKTKKISEERQQLSQPKSSL